MMICYSNDSIIIKFVDMIDVDGKETYFSLLKL